MTELLHRHYSSKAEDEDFPRDQKCYPEVREVFQEGQARSADAERDITGTAQRQLPQVNQRAESSEILIPQQLHLHLHLQSIPWKPVEAF